MTNVNDTMTRFRPVGPKELELMRASGNHTFNRFFQNNQSVIRVEGKDVAAAWEKFGTTRLPRSHR